MLNAGLIGEIGITSFPLVLGDGIPLFAPGASTTSFRTAGVERFDTGPRAVDACCDRLNEA